MIPARELRFVLVFDDYEAAVRLYRDVFGLEVVMDLEADGGRGVILKVPAATLELADVEHGRIVDEVEIGRRLDDRVRIAVKVDDLEGAGEAVAETGAQPMAAPVETPWEIATSGSGRRTVCSSRCSSRRREECSSRCGRVLHARSRSEAERVAPFPSLLGNRPSRGARRRVACNSRSGRPSHRVAISVRLGRRSGSTLRRSDR